MIDRKFITTICVNRRIDAVYAVADEDNDIDDVFRLPIVSIDVYSDYNLVEKCITSDNDLFVLTKDGLLTYFDKIQYFLGIEFDGIQEGFNNYMAMYNEVYKKGDKKND